MWSIAILTVVMLVSSVVSSLSSFCITDQLSKDIRCICGPHDKQPRYLKLSNFEEAATVTIANCETVNFNGGYSYESPPAVIQFINIVDLYHQLDLSIWPPVKGKLAGHIQRIEFINIGTIHELHLNELFPVNHVELMLFDNVTAINKIVSREKPIYESRIDQIRFIKSHVVELMTGSFVLKTSKLFSIDNGTSISHWRKEAVNITNGKKFAIKNSTVNHMEDGAIVGSFAEDFTISSTHFSRVNDRAFNELSKIKSAYIYGNVFKNVSPMTFKKFFFHHGIIVNFSSNSLPCEKSDSLIATPICLGRISESKIIANNYCYPNSMHKFNEFYSVNCDNSLSRIFNQAAQLKLSRFVTLVLILINALLY